jgi:predicted nuclease of predicted toxin-antitoxin system
MRFLVDAQLPKRFANWLSEGGTMRFGTFRR